MQTTVYANGSYGPFTVADSSFSHAFQFTGLSLTDGTPLEPANFLFESGLRFDARPVPEPSTWVLAVTRMLSLGMWRKYSRRFDVPKSA